MKRSLTITSLLPLVVLTFYTGSANAQIVCSAPGVPVGCVATPLDRGAPGVGVLPGPGAGAPGAGVAPGVGTPGVGTPGVGAPGVGASGPGAAPGGGAAGPGAGRNRGGPVNRPGAP